MRTQCDRLDDENRRLRKELKDVVRSQFETIDVNANISQFSETLLSQSAGFAGDDELVRNLEKQLQLIKKVKIKKIFSIHVIALLIICKERDNAMNMWQQTLNQITRLEKENEVNINLISASCNYLRHF